MSARPRVDQLLAGFAEGDAISNEALGLQYWLNRMGFESDLYVDEPRIAPAVRARCRGLTEYRGAADGAMLFHFGITSPATEVFLTAPGRKAMVYHNITPAEFFAGFDDGVVAQLRTARAELQRVAAQADAVWSDSRYNAAELAALGIANVRVFPLLFSPTDGERAADPAILARFSAPLLNILFVGRMAPNKCVEELIQTFAWYQAINPFSRLILVGSRRSAPRYFAMLRMLAGELNLANVCFEDYASPEGLAAYYRLAQVFVSTSRHEGYCLPLLEAMAGGIPVIARSVGGTPEAMDGAGVLYEDLAPPELAELLHCVMSDAALREEILASQRRRMDAVRCRPVEEELRGLLAELLPAFAAR